MTSPGIFAIAHNNTELRKFYGVHGKLVFMKAQLLIATGDAGFTYHQLAN